MTEISGSRTNTIAIVGAGFSGTLCAVNLLRCNLRAGLHIILLDPHARLGRGLAYRTWDDNLVLNVPAGNMSALADDASHFVRYCQSIDPAFNSGSFVSRRIYGDYLEQTLQQAIDEHAAVRFERMQAEVLAVRQQNGQSTYQLELADQRQLNADQVVLAFGHFTPTDPGPFSEFYQSDSYISNPWNFAALDRIDANAPVALLGGAHTALDVLFRLTSQSDARKVYLISRRGLSLQAHRSHPQSPAVAGFPSFFDHVEPTARHYFRALRLKVEEHLASGGDWRDVINSLRPHTPEIWQRLSLRERRRFLSQLLPYWDIHRHRLAPVAHLRFGQMLRAGQVETIAGYVQGYEINAGSVNIEVRERRSGIIRKLNVACVINCTGPNYDIHAIEMPLIKQLNADGYLKQDALKLGFEVNECYQVIDVQGRAADNLYYVGPMLKARYWEAIAVPELRIHTRRLAEVLTG
ncbi:MAG TPA: FAD/NAD(P)-binding protein [Burkholderiaceae bacterium]|jgi:uncharacterized NAD(P)/FAD-binding protein YdhS|nr:FAD/NAD(P)-binding protein [Burkholderiaceae bacterium]